MNIKINKLSEHTGAEVFGVDLKLSSDQRVVNELTKAFSKYSVLVIRDQNLSPNEFYESAKIFGKVFQQHNKKFALKENDLVHYISNKDKFEDGKIYIPGEGYHTDHSNDISPPKTKETAGVAIQFSTPETLPSRNTIPMINTALNTLESGGDQRAHRHNGAALTLAIQAESVYSKIENEKVNWEDGVVLITPGTELHSHHNRGSKRMMSFVVQDEGLHFYLRTTGFSWN